MAEIQTRVNRLTRNKLASFLPNHELIRDFEMLVQDVGVALPEAVEQVQAVADAAQTSAASALTAAEAAQAAAAEASATAEQIALSPDPVPRLLAIISRLEARIAALEQAP